MGLNNSKAGLKSWNKIPEPLNLELTRRNKSTSPSGLVERYRLSPLVLLELVPLHNIQVTVTILVPTHYPQLVMEGGHPAPLTTVLHRGNLGKEQRVELWTWSLSVTQYLELSS